MEASCPDSRNLRLWIKHVRLGVLWHCLAFKLCLNHFKSIRTVYKQTKRKTCSLTSREEFSLKLPRCQFSIGSSLIPRSKVGWTYQLHWFGLWFFKQNMDHEYKYTTTIHHMQFSSFTWQHRAIGHRYRFVFLSNMCSSLPICNLFKSISTQQHSIRSTTSQNINFTAHVKNTSVIK